MKRILCFGDSNTWGWDPASGQRFPADVRWPGVAGALLGGGYALIEEGLNGRTTVFDDPVSDYRNGRHYLVPCLESHAPLDLVVLALGVNDLKARFGASALDISDGANLLARLVQTSAAGREGMPPLLLLVAPSRVGPFSGVFSELFAGAEVKSRRLGAEYARVARERGCAFLDAGEIASSSPRDGIHLEATEHAKLGKALAAAIRAEIG